ncbi:MAG: DUF4340 domain-containing protein [Rhodobacterales bacterium]|nr:DUF4340 domain-containing protein [Rhodobacterales bacterium]
MLLGLDVWAHRTAQAANAPLPSAPAFDAARVTHVQLSQGDARLRLHHTDAGWTVGPQALSGNAPAITALVGRLSTGVHPYSRADEGNLAQYGMTNAEDIRVIVYADDQPLTDIIVGRDAPGGGTFVRWANNPAVYRANILGRAGLSVLPDVWRP